MTKAEKKEKMLEYIDTYISEYGYPPAIRDICSALNIKSTSNVHKYMDELEAEGLIKRNKLKKRAVTTTRKKTEFLEIPVLGNVAAGTPILAVENIDSFFPLPMTFAKNKEVFMLKVKGDSMIDAGILNSDYVIVQKQPNADDGEMVVAMIDGEATVKTLYKEKDRICLQPQNSAYLPIYTTEATILGKVVGVYRIY